ncbi:unnamed protein product [Rotaria magnacalcarata]|uniref:Uncharacterized protein n=1 Tax=Rotaria magnacalcarata TaxID=392030 RepID=A0A8S3HZZ6_9BILA|nr:unnamed protein product [Rotaria magnacalcarata]
MSNYVRHLTKPNPCVMIQRKVKNTSDTIAQNSFSSKDDTSTPDDSIVGPVSNSTLSSQTISGKRKKSNISIA